MVITAYPVNAAPGTFVRFTWSDDLESCNFLVAGFRDEAAEDAALEALLAAKGHEGAHVDGFRIEVS